MRQDLHVGEAGYPLEGARIRLDSWEEGGYTLEDKPNPRGEILVGGDSVAEGYYKLDQETKDTFFVDEEGVKWFRSGDIGEVMPSGSVKIVDRKKDLAKLPNGEYVSLGKVSFHSAFVEPGKLTDFFSADRLSQSWKLSIMWRIVAFVCHKARIISPH